jgi:hypothetical protein
LSIRLLDPLTEYLLLAIPGPGGVRPRSAELRKVLSLAADPLVFPWADSCLIA